MSTEALTTGALWLEDTLQYGSFTLSLSNPKYLAFPIEA